MELTHRPCPFESCGSSDAFTFNTDKGVGYCHSCGTSYPSNKEKYDWASARYPTKSNGKFEVIDEEMKKEFRDHRGITDRTMRTYDVETDVDENNKEIRHGYKYPDGKVKYRIFPKQFTADVGLKTDVFWGMNKFNGGSAKAVTITEGECFTPDAEVLTPRGWVKFSDLYDTDNVMQVESDGSGHWVKPSVIVDKDYEGDLIEYRSGSYYSLTTEKHNLVRNHPKEGYKKFPADTNSFFSIPRTVNMEGFCGYTTEQLKIWIMLSADFSFRKGGDIYGAFKKKRKVERVKLLLDQVGVRYSCNEVANEYYSVFIHRGHNLGFAQKDLPWSMVWSQHKRELLDEVIFWDGNYVKGRNQAEFATNRKHNADVVQALAHSCGYVSTIMNRENQYGSWLKVSILFTKSYSVTQKGYKRVPYSGRVMCVQVPSGMIVIRQKGSISISGNCDAMSAFQMLGSKYPVVSLPSATPKRTILENCFDWLNSFEKIYLSLDTDDKAEAFAMNLMNLFPGRVYKVNHDKYKDANEFLQAGAAQAYTNAWWNAKLFTPSNIYATEEDFVSLYQESQDNAYIPTGIKALDDKILGLMRGHFTVIKAATGLGKSEFMRYLEFNLVKNYPDVKFACWHLEETKLRSLLGIVSYYLKDNLTRKDLIESKGKEKEVLEAIKHITTNTGYMQFHLKEGDGADELITQIRILTQVYGCQFVFFEPISDVVTTSDDKSRESILADLSVRLSKLAAELNVGIVSIGHANDNGDFKYARMIGQRASVVIDLQRDRENEHERLRNTTKIYIRKNRPCGLEGEAGELLFDKETFTLSESDGGF